MDGAVASGDGGGGGRIKAVRETGERRKDGGL
jgi:hypothetical protein